MQQSRACYHCGLPIPKGVNYEVLIEGSAQPMCCPGCQFVAKTIIETGLADYYRYRTTPAMPAALMKETLAEELRLYDRKDIQTDFVAYSEQDKAEAILIIEGITCAACTWLIEHHVNKLNGLQSCSVNLSNGRARVVWNTDSLNLSDILQTIYRIGYQAHPYQPAKQDAIIQSENRHFIRRLGVAGIGMMQVMMYAIALYAGAFDGMAIEHRNFLRWVSLLITTPVVLYSAQPFFSSALRNLKARHLTMDVPISLAIATAYSASIWSTISAGQDVYFDSVCMFTFFLLLGRFLEFRARRKMDQVSHALNQLLPTSVLLVKTSGYEVASLRDIKPKDHILVKVGQTIAADGMIITGQTSINEAQITGEFLPIRKQPGDRVIAGSINIENPITIEITEVGQQTQLSAILRMLDQARAGKPPITLLVDKVAQYFVGLVLLLSVIVAVSWYFVDPRQAFWVTLSVLVITCPCALSLATPTALTAATSFLLKRGFMITHSHTLEGLAQATHIVFDKTGTLTQGRFVLQQVIPISTISKHQCHSIAAALETHSEHPIAQAFETSFLSATAVQCATGAGIEGKIGDEVYRIGNPAYVMDHSGQQLKAVLPPETLSIGQWVLLGNSRELLAWFQLSDQLRPDVISVIRELNHLDLNIELLSGDYAPNVHYLAQQLNIDKVIAGASPGDKLEHIKQLQAAGAKVIMVGDGINDIPVLASADVSIAMTNASDLTKTTADAVLMSGQLGHLIDAIQCARKCRLVIKQNISWALFYNLMALPLAAFGFVPPYLAAIGMSTSSLLVVLNALRLNTATDTNPETSHN